jgi:hypothetical protein
MKESEETPRYEAKEHGKKFLKEAVVAKEHMGGKHESKKEEKKEERKKMERKGGHRKHAGK